MHNLLKSIFLLILYFTGAVYAAPVDVEHQMEYATARNSMAATIMTWYGSLAPEDGHTVFTKIAPKWDDYRSHYPQNIHALKITSTDLTRVESKINQYQFIVNTLISFAHDDSQIGQDTFIFSVLPNSKPILKSVSRAEKTNAISNDTAEFHYNREHYKIREFAYTWIALLDGTKGIDQSIIDFSEAEYAIKIGSNIIEADVESALIQRKKHLTRGGHSLRKLEVNAVEGEEGTFELKLILEWKGRNQKDKAAIAKIEQKIKYHVQDNGVWKIIHIDEQHVLPDIAPWVGLLC